MEQQKKFSVCVFSFIKLMCVLSFILKQICTEETGELLWLYREPAIRRQQNQESLVKYCFNGSIVWRFGGGRGINNQPVVEMLDWSLYWCFFPLNWEILSKWWVKWRAEKSLGIVRRKLGTTLAEIFWGDWDLNKKKRFSCEMLDKIEC